MNDKFDIMMTATLRPDLIKRTFDSFIKNLFGDAITNAKLIMNIDMVGSKTPDKTFHEILNYLETIPFYIKNISVSQTPSFSKAFCRCLGQLSSPYTFNLEEDWEMVKPLSFSNMIDLFKQDNDLVHLRLSSFKSTGESTMKVWNKHIKWNGAFFEIPENLRGTIGWAGHPSLNKTSFLLYFAAILRPDSNPEKQIKGNYIQILKSNFGVFQPKGPCPPIIQDIGRKWMTDNGYQKKGIKAFFTEWEKINE